MPKQRPILFSTTMLQAILEGRKTQTRRIIKPQPSFDQQYIHKGKTIYDGENRRWFYNGILLPDVNCNSSDFGKVLAPLCRFGQVGDILWVKETFTVLDSWDGPVHVMYEDATTAIKELTPDEWKKFDKWKEKEGRKSSLFMFRSLSRISLEITNIRVERLQDISDGDAIAEGVQPNPDGKGGEYFGYKNYFRQGSAAKTVGYGSPKMSFFSLWKSINGWDSVEIDPWVWVIEFKRITRPTEINKEEKETI